MALSAIYSVFGVCLLHFVAPDAMWSCYIVVSDKLISLVTLVGHVYGGSRLSSAQAH